MRFRLLSRTTGAASVDGPSRTLFYWLIGAFLLTLLPHVTQLPGWLSVSIALAVIVRCIAEWRRWPLPTTTSTGVVAICLLGAIFLQFHTVLGRDAGTPFMAGLLTIKFYELRSTRDITLIIFSSFFVVMSALLFSQAIELFVYCLIMMWLLTGILLRTYMGDRADYGLLQMLRASSIIFLQALPLALLVFFFLPRYSGRFQLRLNETVTGISDHVEPGSIAELANDDSPAMRVSFKDSSSIPIASSMYWRAIVLWYFNGWAWTRGPAALTELGEKQLLPAHDGDLVKRWLPALDRAVTPALDPDTGNNWSAVLTGDVLVTPNGEQVDFKRHYTVTSSSFVDDPEPQGAQHDAAVQLPPLDPQVQALADQLYAPDHDTRAYIRAVLHYFRAEHFQLSTEPGRLGRKNSVAEFLFRTKIGFCEHYASAFAVLLRAEKIPTRLVVGYHGGEYNSYGGFYMISQSNAHAWDEVWVGEKDHPHWVRVDPTTVITAGSSEAIAANEGLASADDDLSFSVANRRITLLSGNSLPPWLRHGLRDVAMRREEMEAQWDNWVFSYDPDTQDRLAQALGFRREGWLVLLVGCVTVAGAGGALAAYLLSRKKALSPVEAFYERFCRRMAQRGAPRETWEGPLAYTERLAETFPQHKRRLETAGSIVAEYRYAPGEKRPPGNLRALLRDVSGTK
jgi:transglutaminase-like putative cysteine protease